MVRWKCTQCDESLEAPDDFPDVIECPKCGHYSRPAQASSPKLPHPDLVKAEQEFRASEKSKKSYAEKRFDHYTDGTKWVYRIGTMLCISAILVLWYALAMDTTNGDVHNTGLLNNRLVTAIIGSALFVSGSIGIALGAISTGIIRLMLDVSSETT